MAPRILLVPFPITPLAAFAHFFLSRLGIIASAAAVHYHGAPGSQSTAIALGNGAVLNIASLDLFPYLSSFLAELPEGERYWFKRCLTYCKDGDPKHNHRLQRWLLQHAIAASDAEDVLRAATELFASWSADGVDLWRSAFSLKEPRAADSSFHGAWPLDTRIITIPILKSDEPGEREVADVATFRFHEGRVLALQSARICIGVGGPKGSGKSTLAASLALEMQNEILSLQSRAGWENFSLAVEVVNLDLATPTVDAIAAGRAKGEREALRAQKRPWTEALALEALSALLAAKARANVVIADMPGGITPITEIVAAAADTVILIANDWSLMNPWWNFAAKRMGLELVARARSRRSIPEPDLQGAEGRDTAFTSMVKQHRPGRMISGRVVDLDRIVRSWDPYISRANKFLLFDILPAFVMRRQERLKRDLGEAARL